MQEALPDIAATGAKVAAVCDDLGKDKAGAVRKANISSFPVFEDDTGNAAVKLGIRWPQEEVDAVNDFTGNTLVAFRGTDPWIIPMQARFVIDQTARIVFADIVYDYALRTGPSAFIHRLRGR